jgi:hypothetical protein
VTFVVHGIAHQWNNAVSEGGVRGKLQSQGISLYTSEWFSVGAVVW